VRDGVPFREAHRRTGELLKRLDAEGRTMRDLTSEEWSASGVPNGAELLDPDHAIAARSMPGGPSRASVEAQIAALDSLHIS
jgi:argininosuccinate lyase